MTKERPILFSGPMVRAIRDRRKSMTRRIVKPQPPSYDDVLKRSGSGYSWFTDASSKPGNFRVAGPVWAVRELNESMANQGICCPYGQAGDRLWVKETWRPEQIDSNGAIKVTYAADEYCRWFDAEEIPGDWRMPKAANRGNVSPLFMPRWASRFLLKLEAPRVERLQAISEADAEAEGFHREGCGGEGNTRTFARLWRKINGDSSWDANPWVWVLPFTVQESEAGRAER